MNIFKAVPIHLLGTGILVVLAAGSYVFGIRPTVLTGEELSLVFAETKQLQDQVEQLEAENETLRGMIDTRRQAIQERYTLTTSDQQPLLETVSQRLNSCELELLNFRESRHVGHQESELQLAGSYHNIMRFLYDLRRLDQPAKVVSLQLSANKASGDVFTSKIKIEFAPRSVLIGKAEGDTRVHEQES